MWILNRRYYLRISLNWPWLWIYTTKQLLMRAIKLRER